MAAFFCDQSGRLRTVWRFLIFGFGFLVVQIGVGVALGIGLVVFLLATGKTLNSLDISPQSIEAYSVPLQIIAALPIMLSTFGFVWLCRRFLDRRSLSSLGLVRPGPAPSESVAGGLALGTFPVVFAIVVLLVSGGLAWDGVSASLQTALLVPAFIVMAFFEEIVCRGYLLQNLIDIGRPRFGIWFSSTIFWLLHALNPDAWSSPIVSINLFGAGVTLALAYRVSRNIWFPTAAHFGWNFAQGVLFQVPVSGLKTDGLFDVHVVASFPTWLTGGRFGIEGSILATVAEICMSLVLINVLRRRTPEILIAEAVPQISPAESGSTAASVSQSGSGNEVQERNPDFM
jgi:membrane protease YdiL (CAAX protease family)